MSDAKLRANERNAAVADPPQPLRSEPSGSDEGSFGRALAAAREARGLSRSDVAAQLRLHVRQIEAIEAENLAALPEAPFVRGYLRNYAKLVDLPAEPLLSLLNSKLRPSDPLHAGPAAAVSPLQSTPREPISGRLVIVGVVLLLGLLAALGWWTMRQQAAPAAVPAAAVAVPAPVATLPVAVPAVETEPVAVPAPAADAPPTSRTALRLTFNDRSWVEVRQADGTVLLSQNNAGGTTRVVDGRPPYLLVIGNASKVALEYGGQPVDLASSISRDDVARLRLE